MSKIGVEYTVADGGKIKNEGERVVSMCTPGGQWRDMVFQVCNVNKALGSVSRICARGHRCVFDDAGSFIQHKATGEMIWLEQQNGVYVLDSVIAPWWLEEGNPDFAWQGN